MHFKTAVSYTHLDVYKRQVWESNGSDIYYQGKSNEELPVSVKVTYYLDGKQISPDDLLGKSGKVKIRYDYTNNSSTSVKIDNENSEEMCIRDRDNTADGNLKKRWKIIDKKRCLIKGGSNPFRQQPFNEVIASGIMERLDIPHVSYNVMWNNGAPYSVCEDFVTEDTELVPAWRIMKTLKKDNNVSVYQHFVNCCDALGIKDVVPFLDRMIVLDYIIANEDRHLNNFGALRNAQSLEWIGMAPVFDSGSSLGYDKLAAQIRADKDVI